MAGVLQPGTQLDVEWKARLSEQLGQFRIYPGKSRAAACMTDQLRLSALGSVCALLQRSTPERSPCYDLYSSSVDLLGNLEKALGWKGSYLEWELALLDELGIGLDLGRCAVSGSTKELSYVSPVSGRAVSKSSAGKWERRLLPLPACFLGGDLKDLREMSDGLRTTGHFLEKGLRRIHDSSGLPKAREMFAETVLRLARSDRPQSE